MAVRIRMKRMGRRHRPFYRISVMDIRSPRDGRSIEDVGYYDPMIRDKADRVKLKMDRIDYWLSVGAKPSDKVAVLIKKVKTNTFGEGQAPPPLTPPKAPPEPPEPPELPELPELPEPPEPAETAETASETDSAGAEETTADDASDDQETAADSAEAETPES